MKRRKDGILPANIRYAMMAIYGPSWHMMNDRAIAEALRLVREGLKK